MANPRPLQEAVRGCWYFVSDGFEVDDGLQRPREVMAFFRDGEFTRYEIDGTDRDRVERGDYTFDGDFLIIRGRSTDTYRVHRPSFWQWRLEAKKKERLLLRGFVAGEHREELPEEERRDIRLLPLRARVEVDFEGEDAIHRFVYRRGVRDRRVLASFSVQSDEQSPWLGLAPLVRGLQPKLWERLVRESYLDAHLGDAERPDAIEFHLFGANETRTLEV